MTARKPAGISRIPKRSSGFYRDPETGERYRSVTTILSQGVPKEALVFWAGNLVAESAIQHLPYLVKASRKPDTRKEAQNWLSRAHTRKKEERANIGHAVHKLIEAHILNKPMPAELLDDPEMAPYIKLLDDPEMAPYIKHFLSFIDDWAVTFEASEMVVANDEHKYAGTLDFLARSALIVRELGRLGLLDEADVDMPLMGDTKTGGEMCPGDETCIAVRPYEFKVCPGLMHSIKGVYAEAGLQMSAYRAAKTAWLRDGTKVPMPATHPVGIVLHLTPLGYLIVPTRCHEQVFAHFTHAVHVAQWTSETSKHVLGDALVVPAVVEASI